MRTSGIDPNEVHSALRKQVVPVDCCPKGGEILRGCLTARRVPPMIPECSEPSDQSDKDDEQTAVRRSKRATVPSQMYASSEWTYLPANDWKQEFYKFCANNTCPLETP